MKFFICALALVASAYAAPQAYTNQAQYVSKEGSARIVSLDSEQNPDGSYSYKYETENGIAAAETSVPKPAGPNGEPAPSVQGVYRYTAPDGTPVEITYVADENGYNARGNAIPVAPEIPEAILKSLAWNEAHPAEDETYKPNPVYGRQ
ncbi:endocuticle structural glycoprotein SgAbd-1-like [Neodiprion pinetum]|uniref:Endocuticle structural glycoprotein SgAbd-1 n=1 Tax=Neodiprion lecontei TaxID=441921 RepID=A0A6J0BZ56_NEOLC|nr:endocuticle structural glycoprotein SgAbd-1 [Neodiprion lecontei]XP_046481248.1 endocuticle structural glycoprotein SgAbd-1-like [Neodiprion pinetum]